MYKCYVFLVWLSRDNSTKIIEEKGTEREIGWAHCHIVGRSWGYHLKLSKQIEAI